MGYLSSEKDDPNRFRNALAGGAMGAGVGGLTGALMHRGARGEEEIANLVDKGYDLGFGKGHAQALEQVSNQPDLAVKVLHQMSPEARKIVMKSFEKGWLTRMFGG